jgi:hypothetical protein
VPLEPGFPSVDGKPYDFDREPVLAFPHGPIPAQHFRDRYHSHGDAYWFSRLWRSRSTQIAEGGPPEKRALGFLPKRTEPVLMGNRTCEVFYGLLAVERRCHYRIALHLILLNLVWLVFAPLWILVWGHPSDLQNAFTPLQVALSLQQAFASWNGGT